MGFSFDGISSQEIGIGARITNITQVPQLKNYYGEIAGRHGFFDFGNSFEGRRITVIGTIFPKSTETDFNMVCDKVSGWLNPERGLCRLLLDSQPERFYMARLQQGVDITKGIRHTGTFTLEFISPDPFGYANIDETFTLLENKVIVREKGNTDSEPVYELACVMGDSGWVDILVNGHKIRLLGSLLANESFIVNSKNKTAVIRKENGEQRNALGRLEPLSFPVLRTGNNSVEIVAKDAAFSSLTIKANSRWL